MDGTASTQSRRLIKFITFRSKIGGRLCFVVAAAAARSGCVSFAQGKINPLPPVWWKGAKVIISVVEFGVRLSPSLFAEAFFQQYHRRFTVALLGLWLTALTRRVCWRFGFWALFCCTLLLLIIDTSWLHLNILGRVEHAYTHTDLAGKTTHFKTLARAHSSVKAAPRLALSPVPNLISRASPSLSLSHTCHTINAQAARVARARQHK